VAAHVLVSFILYRRCSALSTHHSSLRTLPWRIAVGRRVRCADPATTSGYTWREPGNDPGTCSTSAFCRMLAGDLGQIRARRVYARASSATASRAPCCSRPLACSQSCSSASPLGDCCQYSWIDHTLMFVALIVAKRARLLPRHSSKKNLPDARRLWYRPSRSQWWYGGPIYLVFGLHLSGLHQVPPVPGDAFVPFL